MHDDLALLIRSGNRLIAIETPDEDRAVAAARDVAGTLGWPVHEWSITAGMDHPEGILAIEADKAEKALAYVQVARGPALFVFKDLAPLAKEPFVQRLLRDLANDRRDFAVVLVNYQPLPDAVRRFVVPYALKYPDPDELEQIVRATFNRIRQSSYSEVRAEITKGEMEKAIQSLRGLGTSEVERAITSAILDDHVLNADDLPRIIEAKRTLPGLQRLPGGDRRQHGDRRTGGHGPAQGVAEKRRNGLTQKARDYGLDPPRGILLLGVQGCGKSLCAKVVAARGTCRLLRMDPGVLYQKFVGETENRLREALAQAESHGAGRPVDRRDREGVRLGRRVSADGGLSQRMFGTLLVLDAGPPPPDLPRRHGEQHRRPAAELMRKGRFDEIFFIDLPKPKSARRSSAIHLRRRGRHPRRSTWRGWSRPADGFTGAEIEAGGHLRHLRRLFRGGRAQRCHLLEEMAPPSPCRS